MGDEIKKKYRSGLRWIVGSGALIALSLGGWYVYTQTLDRSPDAVKVSAIAAELGTVETTVSESGLVELGGQQTLKSPTDGTVDRVLVKVGDRVSLGDELITLKNAEQQTNLALQPIEIQQAQLTLIRSQQKVREAADALAEAQRDYDRIARQNVTRESAIATARLTVRERELTLESDRKQLAEAQDLLQKARSDFDTLVERGNLEIERQLADLKLEIEQKQLAIANERNNLRDAEANAIAAREELEETKELVEKGYVRAQEIRQQEQEVRQRESAVRDAQLTVNNNVLDLQRIELKAKQIESQFQDEIETTEAEVRSARDAVQQAEERVRSGGFELERSQVELQKLVQEPEGELETARQAVRNAEIALKEAQSQADRERLEMARLELESQKIQQQLEDNIMSSPIEGKILEVKVKNGDGIARGSDLLTVGDPSQELVTLQLSPLYAEQVEIDQPARITVPGPEQQVFEGLVQSLSPLAIAGDSSSRSGSLSLVPATVRLTPPSGTLIPGSQVNVEIVVEQRENVIALPLEAIARNGPKPYVWIVDSQGKIQKQNVSLGLEGVTEIEVSAGLKAGDQVVVAPPNVSLEPGMSVIVERSPFGAGGNAPGSSGGRNRPRRRR